MVAVSNSPPPKKGSTQVKGLLDAGVWLQLAGDAQGAHRIFRQALELDPTNVRARELYRATETIELTESVERRPMNATMMVPPGEVLNQMNQAGPLIAPPRAQAPTPKRFGPVDTLVLEAAALRRQGAIDRASGLVLRALELDDSSPDALELAYDLMVAQGRKQEAAVVLTHLVKACVHRGQAQRARSYLPALVAMRGTSSKAAALAAQLMGDAEDTLPPTS